VLCNLAVSQEISAFLTCLLVLDTTKERTDRFLSCSAFVREPSIVKGVECLVESTDGVPGSELYKLLRLSDCDFVECHLFVEALSEDVQGALVVKR
jgi:hypothetical protein